MKALVYTGPFTLEWRDVPEPAVGPGEVLFRPRAVSICGSDLNGYRGKNSMRVAPLVMGHEFSGEVVRAGEGVHLPAGTRAAVNPTLSCGRCDNCLAGRVNLCDYRTIVGTTMPAGPRNGAMAEFVAVPARALLPLPDGVSFDEAALIEPLAVSLHAVKKAGDLGNRSVAVIGAGPIGLLAIMCIAAQQPAGLHCLDPLRSRLDKALELGATAVYDNADAAPTGMDVVVDAVGFEATVVQAMSMVRNGGLVVVVGMGAETATIPLKQLTAHEVRIEGSYTFTTEVAEGLAMLPAMKVSSLLTGRFAMHDGAGAFSRLADGQTEDIKVILENPPA